MFLKCETTLKVYEYKNKNILCRVKVLSSRCGNNNKNEGNTDTCRYLNEGQWSDFSRELMLWLNLNELTLSNESKENVNKWHFNVGTTMRVEVRKSNLSIGDYLKCLQTEEDKHVEDNSAMQYVLDCIMEQTSMLAPPTPTFNTDEYEPLPTTSNINISTISPLSYVPYTPSKRTRRFHSEYQVKTPGLCIRDNELSDDIYSPKPIVETETFAHYKPAPIYRRSVSFDSQLSNVNEAIHETEEDESKDNEVYKTLRTRLKAKKKKGEYVPKANLLKIPIPAYKATPIEEDVKEKEIKPKNQKDETFPKVKSGEKKYSKDIKNREKRIKSDENINNKGKENKDTKLPRQKDSKQSLNSSYSSEDEFEQALRKQNASKNKDNRRDKKQEEKTEKKIDPSTRNLLENNGKKIKEKDYIKSKNIDETSRNSEKHNSAKYKEKTGSKHPHTSNIRRSERSPSKPKRFIAEQEEDCLKKRKKNKSHHSSPLKNKELFGTDDDDEDFVKLKSNDSNNNGSSSKCPDLKTPRHDKNKSSPLVLSSSSSPSSSSKKKRKRAMDCEQEKSGMSKWLGKKSSSSTSNSGDTKIKKSNENTASTSSSSSKDTKATVKKSKKEREKSPTPPQTFDIVMPSKEELEQLRNKHKLQRERNEIVKAALQKLHAPPPKAVEELSLKDMTLNELLNTLDAYKNDLDGIYEKNCKKDHVKGNDGVNHCLVISLIDQKLQFKMLEKLSDIYNTTNNIAQATLFANALLPEWIVRIFMAKFNLSRHQAIEHIENQDAYRSYIDGQNDSTLQFYD